jgi:hypothetical protein
MQRRIVLPALWGLGLFFFLARSAAAGPIAIVSQSVKPDFANQILSFRIQFDQAPDLTALDAGGNPIRSIGYDIKTDSASGSLVDFDRAIRQSGAALSAEAFDRDAEGNLVNPRGPIALHVDGPVVSFASTFQTINDPDGKFLYRVFATENGELVSEGAGATIPLPAGAWAALIGLAAAAGIAATTRATGSRISGI